MFHSFHRSDVHGAGDCICLAGERKKKCLGGRLPLNTGELTALILVARDNKTNTYFECCM